MSLYSERKLRNLEGGRTCGEKQIYLLQMAPSLRRSMERVLSTSV